MASPSAADMIKDVWAINMEEEMDRIASLVDEYPYIAMDTEFPGVVVQAVQNPGYRSMLWKTIQSNVNILRIIQLGVTLADEHGRGPKGTCTWQFHFKFDLESDFFAQDSIEMLERSGINFDRHNQEGINADAFAECLTASGMVLNDAVRWISFHGGYDFGYMVRLLAGDVLPEEEEDFFKLMELWFPYVCDVKYMLKNVPGLNPKVGLTELGQELGVERIGPQHQAGSDSLLTKDAFFAVLKHLPTFRFEDYRNILFGLGSDAQPLSIPNGKFYQVAP